jgi:DNA-binding SARP family transcriptional activator/tetratricopeptide (TPR) repeat protein
MGRDAGLCPDGVSGRPHLTFTVLRAVAVRHRDDWIPLPPPKPQAVLVALLLRANEVVSAGALAESLWGTRPPPTAATALQNHVMRLSRHLGPCAGARIRTVPPGYVADVLDGELDVQRFTRLHDSGRAAGLRGDWEQAAGDLTAALHEFGSGPPLAGVDAPGLHLTEAPRLAEMALQALEWRVDADLSLGRHDDVIAGLRQVALRYPFRERFHEQLVLALARSGRQADALSAYRDARRCIVAELGVEPGPGLRALNQRIIAADPELQAPGPPPWAVPAARVKPQPPGRPEYRVAQLPPDVADFTGRASQTADLAAWITRSGGGHPSDLRIGAVTGPGGAGKTALAIHVAHEVSGQFPDGQLHADLRGGDPRPASSREVLARLLRDLGAARQDMPAAPDADEELQAAYRSLLSGRRMLIVLDNARNAAQVRPLLPGSGDCAVLVTSRRRLAVPDGARVLELGMLSEADALTLLSQVVGGQRVAAEPDAARDVLSACGGLPLAIRIAASRLASRPDWSLRSFADRLADQRGWLDELQSGDRAVRGSFAVSYEGLPQPAGRGDAGPARAFRLLGTWPGPSLSLNGAAAMLGSTPQAAARPVDELADAHLIQSAGPGRYGFHDLLRVYATERAAAEESAPALRAAMRRLVTWYLHTAIAAVHAITPRRSNLPQPPPRGSCRPLSFRTRQAALDWLDSEHQNLVAATTAAARAGLDSAAWRFPAFLHPYFDLRGLYADWLSTHETGKAAARRAGDRVGEAWVLNSLGAALVLIERPAEAARRLRRASALFREAALDGAQACTLNTLGIASIQLGEAGRCVRYLQRALAIRDRIGDLEGKAMTLGNLAMTYRETGEIAVALGYAEQALTAARETGDDRLQGVALTNLGDLLRSAGRPGEAVDVLGQEAGRELTGTRLAQAELFSYLGQAYADLGQPVQAREAWDRALSLYGPLHESHADRVRASLASLREG